MNRIKGFFADFFKGVFMAAADSVPGVSGGTIAFLLGFYGRFVTSVNNFLMGTWEERKAALPFLVKLGLGWGLTFLVCAVILSNLFQTYIYEISSVFIGLTIMAIPIVIRSEIASLRGHLPHVIFTVIGVAAIPLLMLINPTSQAANVDLTQLSLGLGVFLFFAAMFAVSAMILPGISGSTMLLIMGVYIPLISAVSAVAHLQFAYVPALIVFGLGMIAGMCFIVKVVKFCFLRFHSQTIFLCVGLLIGSLYSIVYGATTLKVPMPVMTWETFSIPFFILGAAILIVLEYLRRRAEIKALN
jgi:putative membrane protein